MSKGFDDGPYDNKKTRLVPKKQSFLNYQHKGKLVNRTSIAACTSQANFNNNLYQLPSRHGESQELPQHMTITAEGQISALKSVRNNDLPKVSKNSSSLGMYSEQS